jgi:hypothetical protein
MDYWNGTVLNVAHRMILIDMKFMHVLLQRPKCWNICWDILRPHSYERMKAIECMMNLAELTI